MSRGKEKDAHAKKKTSPLVRESVREATKLLSEESRANVEDTIEKLTHLHGE